MKKQEFNNAPSISGIDVLEVTRNSGHVVNFLTGRRKNGFIYVSEGRIRCDVMSSPAQSYSVENGEMIFIPAGTVYTAEYCDDMTRVSIVQFDLVKGNLPSSLSSPCVMRLSDFKRIIGNVLDCKETTGEVAGIHQMLHTYELLRYAAESVKSLGTTPDRLKPALDEMHSKYNEQRSVKYYADLCYMSETSFRRHFAERMHQSPIEYRNAIRLEQARGLISSGEYTVEEAAFAVGFSNVSFFCRAYKKNFGTTPKGK